MTRFEFETVDVFTDRRFGGNPLAVFPEAEGIKADRMQSLAAEFNLSETTFVLPPADPANTARVRIFNRTAEMAFAGHPSIGTAFVLARRRAVAGGSMRLEMPAGVARVELYLDAAGEPVGGAVEAPQALSLGGSVPVADVAACLGLTPGEICTEAHRPVEASMGNPYLIVEVRPEALGRCEPDRAAFRRALAERGQGSRFSVFAYSRNGDRVRARMFAPLAGTWEDPATGSANAPLAGLLLSLDGGDRLKLEVAQGAELGRPSRLGLEAWRHGDGIRAKVSGSCVPVFTGTYAENPA